MCEERTIWIALPEIQSENKSSLEIFEQEDILESTVCSAEFSRCCLAE